MKNSHQNKLFCDYLSLNFHKDTNPQINKKHVQRSSIRKLNEPIGAETTSGDEINSKRAKKVDRPKYKKENPI